jgi:hypothetical protein
MTGQYRQTPAGFRPWATTDGEAGAYLFVFGLAACLDGIAAASNDRRHARKPVRPAVVSAAER